MKRIVTNKPKNQFSKVHKFLKVMKYLIKHDRSNCIGCGACASICQDFWDMASDNKADLKGAKKLADGSEELEIAKKDHGCAQEAADSCPVNVISITEL